jgi:hypothetical protein
MENILDKYIHRTVKTAEGLPVTLDDRDDWNNARFNGVSASDINKIVSPTLRYSIQQEKLLQLKLGMAEMIDIPNSYTEHGNEREPIILEWAYGNFGIISNRFLFHGDDAQHLATPDGLGEDCVVEVKTSLKPLTEIKRYYMNQMQWQMHVMGVEKCLFIVETHEQFTAKEIEYEWIEKDEARLKVINENVENFIKRLNENR